MKYLFLAILLVFGCAKDQPKPEEKHVLTFSEGCKINCCASGEFDSYWRMKDGTVICPCLDRKSWSKMNPKYDENAKEYCGPLYKEPKK